MLIFYLCQCYNSDFIIFMALQVFYIKDMIASICLVFLSFVDTFLFHDTQTSQKQANETETFRRVRNKHMSQKQAYESETSKPYSITNIKFNNYILDLKSAYAN